MWMGWQRHRNHGSTDIHSGRKIFHDRPDFKADKLVLRENKTRQNNAWGSDRSQNDIDRINDRVNCALQNMTWKMRLKKIVANALEKSSAMTREACWWQLKDTTNRAKCGTLLTCGWPVKSSRLFPQSITLGRPAANTVQSRNYCRTQVLFVSTDPRTGLVGCSLVKEDINWSDLIFGTIRFFQRIIRYASENLIMWKSVILYALMVISV